MKIRIIMNVDQEYEDPGHVMGITEEAYMGLMDVLGTFGEDIEIERES